ncbi:hypothetical protein [Streptomyces sp. NPDC059009]|uniref:hypothetical protein n=1 Tax=Streptomyces sp. NPDC059009 TaxID=3346694 RepID=UPI00368E48C1
MGGRHVQRALRLLEGSLSDAAALSEGHLMGAACSAVAELGSRERLVPLLRDLAAGAGDPAGCARLSYRHVLGFDKLLLVDGGPCRMLRAHIWHPGVRTESREDIHNHRSPLASHVVRGALGMELYETAPEGSIPASWYRESLSAREGDWLLEPAGPARLRLTQVARYGAGSGYALPPYALHRAWCASAGPTVTLFLETGSVRRRYTDVFAASGVRRGGTAVPKRPLAAAEYLAELGTLADLLSDRRVRKSARVRPGRAGTAGRRP